MLSSRRFVPRRPDRIQLHQHRTYDVSFGQPVNVGLIPVNDVTNTKIDLQANAAQPVRTVDHPLSDPVRGCDKDGRYDVI